MPRGSRHGPQTRRATVAVDFHSRPWDSGTAGLGCWASGEKGRGGRSEGQLGTARYLIDWVLDVVRLMARERLVREYGLGATGVESCSRLLAVPPLVSGVTLGWRRLMRC